MLLKNDLKPIGRKELEVENQDDQFLILRKVIYLNDSELKQK